MVRVRVLGLALVRLILEGILRKDCGGNGGSDLFLFATALIDLSASGSSEGVLGLRLDAVEGVLRVSCRTLSESLEPALIELWRE